MAYPLIYQDLSGQTTDLTLSRQVRCWEMIDSEPVACDETT